MPSNAGLYSSKLDSRLCQHDDEAAPKGYIDRSDWKNEMIRTHDNVRCPGCGYYRRWVKRDKPRSDAQMKRLLGYLPASREGTRE